jgi:DNA-binding HxlR family transcriptional regulator
MGYRVEGDQVQICGAMGDILNRIGDKWSVMVVGHLTKKTMRFNELRHSIGGISQRMLTLTLRNLERDGLVIHTVYPEIPPRVEYQLTELGRTLTDPLDTLWNWAAAHMASVNEARDNYDRTHTTDAAPKSEPRRYAGAAN